MPADEHITPWISKLRQGDSRAAQELWNHYYDRLVRLARKKLRGRTLSVADEEDVAASAFESFCLGAERGRYPDLADRHDLWRLLVVIAAHKALRLVRDAGRQKRGGKVKVLTNVDLLDSNAQIIDNAVGSEPTPEFAAQVAEECQRLLAALASPELKNIAVCKMEGYTNAEIAAQLNCAPRTVERKLRLIRNTWEQ